jgi:hypothetical protein
MLLHSYDMLLTKLTLDNAFRNNRDNGHQEEPREENITGGWQFKCHMHCLPI